MAEALVDRTSGTTIGDMTSNGGIAAAYNGNTSQVLTACARVAAFPTSGYVGKTWGIAKVFSRATIYGSSNQGFFDTDNRACIINFKAKNGVAPTGPDDAGLTVIGSAAFTDTGDESAGRAITSTDTVNAWLHWIVQIKLNTGGTAQMNCAQVVQWELTSGSLLMPASPMAHMIIR